MSRLPRLAGPRAARVTVRTRLTRGALLAATVLLAGAASIGPAHASDSLPYTDPNAAGQVGFCDQNGKPVTHGSINAVPFVWRAVGTFAAPPPYNGTGRTAILIGYQPRPGVDPADWSGEGLTAASNYTDPAHPMAAATYGDESLATFIGDYPPKQDGLIQVRIYLGLPDHPQYSAKYSAASIRVTGDMWTLVQGDSNPDCGSGKSLSQESVYLPPSMTSVSPTPSKPAVGGPTSGSPSSASASGSTAQAGAAPSGSASSTGASSVPAAASKAVKSSSSATLVVSLVVVVVVAVAGVGGYLWWRRARPAA